MLSASISFWNFSELKYVATYFARSKITMLNCYCGSCSCSSSLNCTLMMQLVRSVYSRFVVWPRTISITSDRMSS